MGEVTEETEYLYSKPFGFQRIIKHKSKVELGSEGHSVGGEATSSSQPTYDMRQLLSCSDSAHRFQHSFPEFLGPLSIGFSQQRGRGVFATQDITPGDLLIASRALAIVFPDSASSTSRLWKEVQKLGALRQEIGQLVGNDTEKASQVYHLYAGPKLGYVDLQEGPLQMGVDIERIERICSFNAFQGSVQGCEAESCFGLWYFPSFLNHDCVDANARWTIFKNFMFVRAHRPIKKGCEVLICYVDPNDSVVFRRNFFLKHEFLCECALCRTERAEGQCVRRRREIILEDFRDMDLDADDGSCLEALECVIEELDSLRPTHAPLNVFLIQPLLAAGLKHYEKGKYEDALPFFLRAFDLSALSSQMSLLCVSCAFTIATSFLRKGKMELAKQWVEISKEWVVNIYGTTEVIDILRPHFYQEMILYKLLE